MGMGMGMGMGIGMGMGMGGGGGRLELVADAFRILDTDTHTAHVARSIDLHTCICTGGSLRP